jgi:hypothetical protein
MKTTKVHNLSTQQVAEYTLEPREAVIAAYAQSCNDFNTWDYEKKYGKKVQSIKRPKHITWNLGDWTAVER